MLSKLCDILVWNLLLHLQCLTPTFRTATENVYTLLQPPRSAARAGSPGEGADGKMIDHHGKNTLVLSPTPVPGIPHPGVGGSKPPFYSPREVQSVWRATVSVCAESFSQFAVVLSSCCVLIESWSRCCVRPAAGDGHALGGRQTEIHGAGANRQAAVGSEWSACRETAGWRQAARENFWRGESHRQTNGQVQDWEQTSKQTRGQTVDSGQTHPAADWQKDRKTVDGREATRQVVVREQADGHTVGQSVDWEQTAEQEDRQASASASFGSKAAAALPVGQDAVPETGNGCSESHRGHRVASAGNAGRQTHVSWCCWRVYRRTERRHRRSRRRSSCSHCI